MNLLLILTMAKELPYFRFTAFEWLNDDISLESYELKGLFADVCAYYWFKDCSLTIAMLEKRFNNAKDLIQELIILKILKLDAHDYIIISFLDKQYDILSEKRKKRQKAGQKGGLKKSSNAKAKLKQKTSYKDKEKDKDNDINKRKQVFQTHINEVLKSERKKYINNKQDIIDFFEYWTEHGTKDKKMRFEKETSFGIARRLDTWFKNKEKFKTNNKKAHIQKDQSDFTKKDTGWN
jgi:hypothetical protein